MYTLLPERIQSSPSRRAIVVMLCELDPASASVIPNAMMREPSASPGSHSCFWAAVPYLEMMVPQMAGETTTSSSPAPLADNSSCTSASS